ncbi:hypothetical protein AB0J38_08840 [Streptomyces sp. NPDC050095]|uniref:hypothetical protein n=1 Tax=unclassified Streptomyces TaxID=2593676 RepID=UPI003432B2C4
MNPPAAAPAGREGRVLVITVTIAVLVLVLACAGVSPEWLAASASLCAALTEVTRRD